MTRKEQIHSMAYWASQVAQQHDKSITYVLMKIHEARTICPDADVVKAYVLKELGR